MALRRAGSARDVERGDLGIGPIAVALALVLAQGPPVSARTFEEPPPPEPKPIEYMADLDAALAAAKQSGQPIVVVFGAVWCQPCRVFTERTLSAPQVRSVAPSFHWVYVDIDSDVTLTRNHGVEATPTTVILRSDGTTLTKVEGAFDAATFRAFLESVDDPSAVDDVQALELEDGHPTRLTWNPRGYRARAMCYSQIGYGPLSLPSQAPTQVLRLGLRPRTPSTLAGGQFEFLWTESFANIFNFREDDYRLDYGALSSNLAIAYGVSDTVEVELAVGNLMRTYSYLDGVTDAFHDLFGIGDAGRDDFPSNENIIDLEEENGVAIEDESAGSEATHVTLTLQHNVTCGTDVLPALAYAFSTRWDAGGDAELEGSSDFSAGVSVSAAKRLGEEFYTYLGLGYFWYGPDEARGLPLKDEQWGGLAALEWAYKSKRSLILEYLVNEGAALDRSPFDEVTHEVHFGWKREMNPGTVLELGLIENLINADNSPDIGLHIGIRHRF